MALNPILNDSIANYYTGTASEVWVYSLLLDVNNPLLPTTTNITTTASVVAIASTAIPTVATTVAYKRGARFVSADGLRCFMLSADVAAGVTSLPVFATKSAIPASTVFTAYALLPVFSVTEAGFKADGDVVAFRNFGAGAFTIQSKTKLSGTIDMNGYVTKGDPGMAILRSAARITGSYVWLELVNPDDTVTACYAHVKSYEDKKKTDDPYMISVSAVVASDPRFSDYTLR